MHCHVAHSVILVYNMGEKSMLLINCGNSMSFCSNREVTYPFFFWNKRAETDILRLRSTSTCRHHSIHGMRTGIFHNDK